MSETDTLQDEHAALLACADILGNRQVTQVDGEVVFTNSPAIALGELSLEQVAAVMNAQFPVSSRETANFSIECLDTHTRQLFVDLTTVNIYGREMAGCIQAIFSRTTKLINPLMPRYRFSKAYLSFIDEEVLPTVTVGSEVPHIDSSIPTGKVVLHTAYPQNTHYLQTGTFRGLSIDQIFPASDLNDSDIARIKTEDWVTQEKQAYLFGFSSSIHKKPTRSTDTTSRLRATWRVELDPRPSR